MAFPFFCPQFFCPLELPASFVRVVGFDQDPSVQHPRPSRLFFLLTSGRRHSASVSEILNVAPLRSLSTDVRHPFRITNPGSRTPEPKTRGSETPGLPAPGIASKPPTSPRTQRLPGVPVACPRSIPERMLAKFRPARYDDRRRAGRRSPTAGGPQPARNDEQSDAREAAATSSPMVGSRAPPA